MRQYVFTLSLKDSMYFIWPGNDNSTLDVKYTFRNSLAMTSIFDCTLIQTFQLKLPLSQWQHTDCTSVRSMELMRHISIVEHQFCKYFARLAAPARYRPTCNQHAGSSNIYCLAAPLIRRLIPYLPLQLYLGLFANDNHDRLFRCVRNAYTCDLLEKF